MTVLTDLLPRTRTRSMLGAISTILILAACTATTSSRKGSTFFAITDIGTLGVKAPSSASLKAQAMTSLARLP